MLNYFMDPYPQYIYLRSGRLVPRSASEAIMMLDDLERCLEMTNAMQAGMVNQQVVYKDRPCQIPTNKKLILIK